MSLYSEWARKRRTKEIEEGYENQKRHEMQKLSEWLETKNNSKALFIDQDETLLVTRNMETLVRMGSWANQNAKHGNIMGNNVGIVVRPHAREFLEACRKIAPTFILTAGITPFQEEVLEMANLLDVVKEVYGRDRYQLVPKTHAGLLVDNMHPHSSIVQEKLNAMGGGLYVNIPDWEGTNPNDKALPSVLAAIKKSFG